MSFEAPESPRNTQMDPMEIQNKTFPSAWKGYKIDDVRAFLAQVSFGVREFATEAEAMRRRIDELERNQNHSDTALNMKVAKAEETAARIIHDANEAARALRSQAESILASTKERAESEALELIDRAKLAEQQRGASTEDRAALLQLETAAKRELDNARAKAAEIIERSKAEGRAMIDQARDLRNEILADLRERKSALDTEIADLATRRIEAYQNLSRAVMLISEASLIVESGSDGVHDDDPLVQQWSGDAEAETAMPSAADESSASKARSPLLDTQDLQLSVSISPVEIGNHLEEGIVRVFHKESELSIHSSHGSALGSGSPPLPRSDADLQATEPHENGPAEEVREGDGNGASVGDILVTQGDLDTEPENELQGANDDRSALEATIARDGVIHEEGGIAAEAGSDENSSEWIEQAQVDDDVNTQANGVEDPETMAKIGRAENANVLVEASEKDPASDRQREMALSPHQEMLTSGASGSARSRRADDILARIRSLRFEDNDAGPVAARKREGQDGEFPDGERDPILGRGSELAARAGSEEGSDLRQDARDPVEDGGSSQIYETPAEVDAATAELLDVREEILGPVATMLFKKAKRLVADEQNVLLDKVRRSSGSKITLEELLEEKVHIDAIAIAALDFFEQVRLGVLDLFSDSDGGSARREISQHALYYSEEFAKELVLPLRRRIQQTLSLDSTAEDQSTVSAIGSVYRDLRSNRLETLISQYVNSVFCATIMHESGYDSFLWAVDPQDTPCADCLDNSLAGTTPKGEQFPTGHLHPAIHSGCRCLLVPFIA